jgi:Family of unknown function (DUF6519)/Right handed beta helix region
MPSIDLSRFATDFRKHYNSVRMQQGRVLSEDDFNEGARLDQEDERRTRIHVIGPSGSPDGGFLIGNPTAAGGVADFTIGAGTMYVGGLRLELQSPESYRSQQDWLRPDPIPLPGASRFDLVYLEAWQQPVTAVEDSELFEVALGVDSSTRIRTMRRIHVIANMGSADCGHAWTTFLRTNSSSGTLNAETELVTDARLTVEFDPRGNATDLCSPAVAGGYLGAENQAIRVQLVDATHFTWGFDNGTPLYRVQVGTNSAGQRRLLTLVTEPRDQAHWPLSGQVVELLPWSAVLPNNEKLAELSGLLAKVTASYNPDTHTLAIDTSVPAGFGEEWKTRPDAPALQAGGEYFYLRVWNRGGDTVSPAAIPFVAGGAAVPLRQTGLRVSLTGTQHRATDFWVIAARPESPNRVVPWQLETGRGPQGYRRFLTPLGVIQWNAGVGQVIDDCRETFPPLTRRRTCCSFSVGDGVTSHGHFDSVQTAVDHLPAGGGEICLLPGRHVGLVTILGRENIVIHGCGARSVLAAPDQTANPVVAIHDSRNVRLHSLAIEAGLGAGVELRQSGRLPLESIALDHLRIVDAGRGAIDGRGGRRIRVVDNVVELAAFKAAPEPESIARLAPAIFLAGDDVVIERNEVAANAALPRSARPLGGVQIGGGSERVRIRENVIHGGNGNGITLGSVVFVPRRLRARLEVDYARIMSAVRLLAPNFHVAVDGDGCPHFDPDPVPPDQPDGPLVPVSEGNLEDIWILDNEIADCGGSGISVARFLAPAEGVILVRELTIDRNMISDCLQLEIGGARTPTGTRAFGGIALAACEGIEIRLNHIERCGLRHGDPACGVFVAQASGLIVSHNEIVDNGSAPDRLRATAGARGGIVIGLALVPIIERRRTGLSARPAAQIDGNIVVAPAGEALRVVGRGVISVHGNSLTAHARGISVGPIVGGTLAPDFPFLATRRFAAAEPAGGSDGAPAVRPTLDLSSVATGLVPGTVAAAATQVLTGAAVTIVQLAASKEIGGLFATFSRMATLNTAFEGRPVIGPAAPAAGVSAQPGTGGMILFNDNQVHFFATGRGATAAPAAVTILGMDDVGVGGNQSDCVTEQRLQSNTIVVGWSCRVVNNRFKELPRQAVLSATTVGQINLTAHNHGTHCFFARGVRVTRAPNHSVLELSNPRACTALNGIRPGGGLIGVRATRLRRNP